VALFQTQDVRRHQPSKATAAAKTAKALSPAEKELRSKLVSLLKQAGKKFKSPLLSTLATKAAEDPFAKVKVMIQELIERLLAEEADEASHKGWCDTEMGKVLKDRDYRLRDMGAAHTQVEELNARMEVLELDEKKLTEEIAHLTSDLENQTAARSEESAENKQTVEDAKEGVTAVQEAMDILSHFYGTAANAELLQARADPDAEAPDAGFEGSYRGAQGASEGVLGLLDVIKSDFERSVTETEAAEAQAKKDFVDFERETKTSIATKQTALDTISTELTDVKAKLSEAEESVRSTQELLDTAVKTWEELIPQCIADPGMTAEERAQAREQEIAALKEAYTILSGDEAFLQKRARY